jgi:hypothetical protein
MEIFLDNFRTEEDRENYEKDQEEANRQVNTTPYHTTTLARKTSERGRFIIQKSTNDQRERQIFHPKIDK